MFELIENCRWVLVGFLYDDLGHRYDAPGVASGDGPDVAADAGAAGVVSTARTLVNDLSQVLWAARSDEELLRVNAEIERLRSTLSSVQLQVAVEIEAKDAARAAAWGSPGDYLTAAAGGHRGHGQRVLRTGRALCDDRRVTMRALRQGDISPEHAHVIVKLVNLLPTDIELRDTAEAFLVAQAAHLNATELRIAGEHLLELLDPDGHKRREEKRLDAHERSAHLNRFLAIVDDGIGGVKLSGRGTVEDAAVIRAALAALSAPAAKELENTDPECGGSGRDIRDHGARQWDALVDLSQRALDAEVLPTSSGHKPRVNVTIDLDALRDQVGVGTLDTGARLSAAAVRKLACDAEIVPVVLGTDGQVLDVGRAARLAVGPVRDAVVLRDRHCRFPGCRRPPIACDVHHVVHLVDGGRTDQDNLVLLCRAHHTILHATEWQVRISQVTGQAEFRPPPSGRRCRDRMLQSVEQVDDGWIRERRPRG